MPSSEGMSAHPLAGWLQTRVAPDAEPILPSRRRTRKAPRHRNERAVREAASHRLTARRCRCSGWSMSLPDAYPPDTYHGDTGEVSAWVRRSDTQPEIEYARGGSCEYIVTGQQSEGRFGLYRWTFGDAESGPDPHFHRSISESFFVLSGEVRLYDGAGWVTAGAGDFLHVPDGGLHGFKGSDRASMLLMFTPGCAARGLLRDPGPARPRRDHDRGGAGGVHAPARHLLGRVTAQWRHDDRAPPPPGAAAPHLRGARRAARPPPCGAARHRHRPPRRTPPRPGRA